MDKLKEINKLKKKLKKLRKVEAINEGGCGIVAKYMHTYLKKLGIEHKIIMFDRGYFDTSYVNKKIMNNIIYKDFIYFAVKISDKILDVDNAHKSLSGFYEYYITEDFLEVQLKHKEFWNPHFDFNNEKLIKEKLIA